MKLRVDSKEQADTNAEQSVINLFNYINDYLANLQQLVSWLIIDGVWHEIIPQVHRLEAESL